MRTITFLVWTMLAAAALSAEEPVVISPISYERPVSLDVVLTAYELRESLSLAIKLAGVEQVSDSVYPAPEVGYNKIPIEGLLNLTWQPYYVVYLTVSESIEAKLYSKTGTELDTQTLELDGLEAASIAQFAADIAGKIRELQSATADLDPDTGLPKPKKEKKEPTFKLSGNMSLENLKSSEPLDWCYVERLIELNKLFADIQPASAKISTVANAARLASIHAAYFTCADTLTCFAYYGKALALSDLLIMKSPGLEDAKKLRNEIDFLAKRYACLKWPLLPEGETVLPELSYVEEHERSLLENMHEYPPIRNLFDLLVRKECQKYVRGYKDAMKAFADHLRSLKDILVLRGFDYSILYARSRGQWFDFDGLALLQGYLDAGISPAIECALLAHSGFDGDLFESLHQFANNDWDLLDNVGVLAKKSENDSQEMLAESKTRQSLVDIRSLAARLKDGSWHSSSDLRLNQRDIARELINRHLALLNSRIARFKYLGFGGRIEAINSMLARYEMTEDVSRVFLVPPAEITREDISDTGILLSQLRDELASKDPTPAKRLLSDGSKTLLLQQGNEQVNEQMMHRVIEDFNSALSDPALYAPDVFLCYKQDYARMAKLEDAGESTQPEEVRRFNRELLSLAYPGLVASPLVRLQPRNLKNASDYPEDNGLGRPDSIVQLQLEAMLRIAKLKLHGAGLYSEALETVQPLVAWTEQKDGSIPYLFELYCRAGRYRDGLAVETKLEPTGFGKDDARKQMQFFSNEDLEPYRSYMSERTTNSDRDYVARALFALRQGDYETMLQVSNAYHYGNDQGNDYIHTLARICVDSENDEAMWSQLKSQFAGKVYHEYDEQVLRALEKRFGDNPLFVRFRKDTRIEEWAAAARVKRILLCAPTPADLFDCFQTMKAITQRHLDEGRPTAIPEVDTALDLEHEAFGRSVLKSLQSGDSAEVEQLQPERDALIAKSHHFAMKPEYEEVVPPKELHFIQIMLQFGGDPGLVAEYAQKIPDLPKYYARTSRPLGRMVSSPKGLIKYYATLQRMLNPAYQANPATPSDDLVWLFSWAFEEGLDELAEDCALERAYVSGKCDLATYYFPDQDYAFKWIERNAATEEQRVQWRDWVEEGKKNARLGRVKRDPTLPVPAGLDDVTQYILRAYVPREYESAVSQP